jgi:predicted RNA polymerase sigma factor
VFRVLAAATEEGDDTPFLLFFCCCHPDLAPASQVALTLRAVVLRVLSLVHTTGHAGRVDLAGEAIRLARQLTLATEDPEVRGPPSVLVRVTLDRPVSADPRHSQASPRRPV